MARLNIPGQVLLECGGSRVPSVCLLGSFCCVLEYPMLIAYRNRREKKCQHWWASCRVLYKWYFFSEHWRKINRHLWFRFSLSKLKSYYKAHPKTMKEYFLPLTRLAFATVFVLAFIVWPSPWLPYEFILIRLYHLHANYNTSFNTYHYRVSTGCTAQAPDIPCCLWDLVTLTWLISWKWKKIRKN